MIYSEICLLFFTVAVFRLNLAKGDCFLWARNREDIRFMPIAYTYQNGRATIIQPDNKSVMQVGVNTQIQFSCSNSNFENPHLYSIGTADLSATCIEGKKLRINNKTFYYDQLKCQYAVLSKMTVTTQPCRPYGIVIKVGYPVGLTPGRRSSYFHLYSVCFDKISKYTLYSWHYPTTPFINVQQPRNQTSAFFQPKPDMYATEDAFSDLDVSVLYENFIRSVKYGGNTITRGHLIPRSNYFFLCDQVSTYNYVNATPQWSNVNQSIAYVEENIRATMIQSPNVRRVIVSGSYKRFKVLVQKSSYQDLFIDGFNKQIPVPLYLWTVMYDLDHPNNSVVYISLNSPHYPAWTIHINGLLCTKKDCPTTSALPSVGVRFFCCTYQSFKSKYGVISEDLFGIQDSGNVSHARRVTYS